MNPDCPELHSGCMWAPVSPPYLGNRSSGLPDPHSDESVSQDLSLPVGIGVSIGSISLQERFSGFQRDYSYSFLCSLYGFSATWARSLFELPGFISVSIAGGVAAFCPLQWLGTALPYFQGASPPHKESHGASP